MSRHDDDKSDPVGTALFTAIIVLLAIIVLVQIGIAKGRQMERDEMWKSFPYNIVFQNITGH